MIDQGVFPPPLVNGAPVLLGQLFWQTYWLSAADSTEEFFTPNEKFFVRNHLPVPTGDIVDPKTYVLEIVPGEDKKPVKISLKDLQDTRVLLRIVAAIECQLVGLYTLR